MKKLALFIFMIALLSCAGADATTPPAAAPAAPAASAQASKMKQCATAYHARKIDKAQYRPFMSACLKKGADPATVAIPAATTAAKTMKAPATPAAAPATAVTTAPPSKMKSCNDNAKTQNLTGDARKAFMKTCLSN